MEQQEKTEQALSAKESKAMKKEEKRKLKEKTPQSIEITAFLVRLPGLEPGASGLGGSRSIQLSYRRG